MAVVNASSRISGESNEGASGGIVDRFESKTLAKNPIDKGVLSEGFRVSEDSKVLNGGSNTENVINGRGKELVESGRLKINDKFNISRSQMRSRSNRWDSWGVMNMVGRVLGGKFSMDDEVEDDVNPSKYGSDASVVTDTNTWQVAIGEPTSMNKSDVERTVVDKDSDELISNNLVEDTGLNGGHQDSLSNELAPEVSSLNGPHQMTEKEGEYYVSDLVWGKVKSHPWWPGQIFPPTAASDKASKHFRKRSYLIAYFGDKTFAWNKGSQLKPFRMYFSQKEKQSNSDGFCHAVSCALDEVTRRVEFGLSCPCLSEEVQDKIKIQVVSNAGILEDKNIVYGGDDLSSAASFSSGNLVQFVESVAECPQLKINRLQFTIAKAQLLAFNRWKGHYKLPFFEEYVGLLEDDTQVAVKKRKHPSVDKEFPILKEKRISALMSSDTSALPNVDEKPVKMAKRPVSSGKNSKGTDSITRISKAKRRKSPFPRIGEESELVEIIPTEIPTPDAIHSKLILSAKVPMQGVNVMISEVDFLREFRNSVCLENKASSENAQTHSENANVVFGFEKRSEEYQPTALILNFTNLDSIPSVSDLNEIFNRYGPVNESETEILRKSKRVKVIFKRRADAETAFSSTGKYSIFGPSLVSYKLHYAPTPRKSRGASKRSKKGTSPKVDA